MRRLLLVLVLLVGGLAVLDRVAALAAERVVSERIQQNAGLASRPDVSIGGFPFLTQAADGTYDDVTVTVHGVRRGDLVVDTIRAHMTGVTVPASDVVRQRVNRVHIAHARAEILLTYDDVNKLL